MKPGNCCMLAGLCIEHMCKEKKLVFLKFMSPVAVFGESDFFITAVGYF